MRWAFSILLNNWIMLIQTSLIPMSFAIFESLSLSLCILWHMIYINTYSLQNDDRTIFSLVSEHYLSLSLPLQLTLVNSCQLSFYDWNILRLIKYMYKVWYTYIHMLAINIERQKYWEKSIGAFKFESKVSYFHFSRNIICIPSSGNNKNNT